MAYSSDYKNAILAQLDGDHPKSIAELAAKEKLSEESIRRWRRQAQAEGRVIPTAREKFSSAQKFQIVLETAALTEEETAIYARKKGFFLSELKQWRENCLQANNPSSPALSQIANALKEVRRKNKELEKDLNRKNKALAETSALLVLRKKANAIWGDHEDD